MCRQVPHPQPPAACGLVKLTMSCVAGDVWVALSCIGHLVRSAILSDGCDILAFDLSEDAKDVFLLDSGIWSRKELKKIKRTLLF